MSNQQADCRPLRKVSRSVSVPAMEKKAFRRSLLHSVKKEANAVENLQKEARVGPWIRYGLPLAGALGAGGLAWWKIRSLKPPGGYYTLTPDPKSSLEVSPGNILKGVRVDFSHDYRQALENARRLHQKQMEMSSLLDPMNLAKYVNPAYLRYGFQQVGNELKAVPYFYIPGWFGGKYVPLTKETLQDYAMTANPFMARFWANPLRAGGSSELRSIFDRQKALVKEIKNMGESVLGQTTYDPQTGVVRDILGNILTPDNNLYASRVIPVEGAQARSAIPADVRGYPMLPLVY